MHRLKSNLGRGLPAVAITLAVAAAFAIIVSMNLGSGTSSVSATNPTPTGTLAPGQELQKFTGLSCADIYLDFAPLNPMGTEPGKEDVPVAAALNRTEPSLTNPGKLDITTATYQGPDMVTGDEGTGPGGAILDAVPDAGPNIDDCEVSRINGQNGKEHEVMNQRTAFQNQFGNRPTAQASIITGTYDPTNPEDGAGANTCFDNLDNGPVQDGELDAGDPDCFDASSTVNIHFTTCGFSEVLSVWQRTDSTNVISDKSATALNAQALNYGRVTLYVASGRPDAAGDPPKQNDAVNPRTCSVGPEVGAQCAAPDAIDDDRDGVVNDGCPAVGTAEVGAGCANAIDENSLDTAAVGHEDDDGDGVHNEIVQDGDNGAVNDGCPAVSALPFASVTKVYSRDATTDKPTEGNNAAAILGGNLSVDVDGCNPTYGTPVATKPPPLPTKTRPATATRPPAPTAKPAGTATATQPPTATRPPTPTTTPKPGLPTLSAPCNPKPKDGQERDGDTEQYVGFKADDWDGDGCPDWDELDNSFVYDYTTPNSTNQNGMDPYNPNDCDKNFNGNIGLLVTVFHDNSVCTVGQVVTPGACAPGGSPGSPNGQYFFCLTNVTHTLGVDTIPGGDLQEAVNWVAGCYSDSTVQVVNPSYFAETVCTGNADDDTGGGDTFVNDGCPAVAETVCTGNADDDNDNRVNDGCPKVGTFSETLAQCTDGVDAPDEDPGAPVTDDDTVVNDGCPAAGESQQCNNNGDDEFPADGSVNDGCPQVGGASEATNGILCSNANNDDSGDDGLVNDGCPTVGSFPESGIAGACADAIDAADEDPGGPDVQDDTVVNDGCPTVGSTAESALGNGCANAVDDDGDGKVNDGCPTVGAVESNQCSDGNDAPTTDGKVNDGCGSKPDSCLFAPVAAQDNCGDGRAGPRPPGGSQPNSPQAFIAIDDQSFPVPFTGTYDHTDNRLKFDFCLIGFGGDVFGPNVHAVGNIDAHTGAGTMDLYGGFTNPTCSGPPGLTLLANQVEMVERGQNIDSDHDGCTDNQELASSVASGGKRDPFNKWDYFNPALNSGNGTADITAVVLHYGFLPPAAGYKERYDRGGSIAGSHPWNFRPPNGNINTGDITAAVNSYGHNCNAKIPPPYTS